MADDAVQKLRAHMVELQAKLAAASTARNDIVARHAIDDEIAQTAIALKRASRRET